MPGFPLLSFELVFIEMDDAFMRREVCKSNTCCNRGAEGFGGILWPSSGDSGNDSSTIDNVGDTAPSPKSSSVASLGITWMQSSTRTLIQSVFSGHEEGGKASSERMNAQASVPDLPLPAT